MPAPTEPMVVCRIEKIHTVPQLTAIGKHNTRVHNTDNADPNRRHLNRILVGSPDIADDLMKLYKSWGIEKFRRNGVLAVEMVLSFSPTWIKRGDGVYLPDARQKVTSWVKACITWAQSRFGENLISCIYHGDETTPHLHMVLGVGYHDKKRDCKRLSADRFFGSRAKLSQLQTDHAAAVAHLGLKRGMQGSKTKHQTLRQFYSEVNKAEVACRETNLTPPETNTPQAFTQWQRHIQQLSNEREDEFEAREELYLAEIAYWKSRYNDLLTQINTPAAKPKFH